MKGTTRLLDKINIRVIHGYAERSIKVFTIGFRAARCSRAILPSVLRKSRVALPILVPLLFLAKCPNRNKTDAPWKEHSAQRIPRGRIVIARDKEKLARPAPFSRWSGAKRRIPEEVLTVYGKLNFTVASGDSLTVIYTPCSRNSAIRRCHDGRIYLFNVIGIDWQPASRALDGNLFFEIIVQDWIFYYVRKKVIFYLRLSNNISLTESTKARFGK